MLNLLAFLAVKVVSRLQLVVPAHPMLVSLVKVVCVLLSFVACAVRV